MKKEAMETARAVVRSRNLKVVDQHETLLAIFLERLKTLHRKGWSANKAQQVKDALDCIDQLAPKQQKAILALLSHSTDIECCANSFAIDIERLASPPVTPLLLNGGSSQ